MDIQLITQPPQADLACLSESYPGLQSRNHPGISEVSEERRFVVLARGSSGIVAGGLRASAYWGFLTIELLWLSETARGHGIGRALVAQAEAFATAQGFRHARVETTSFQAKPFYEHLGYEVYGVLEDFPPGHCSYSLRKTFAKND